MASYSIDSDQEGAECLNSARSVSSMDNDLHLSEQKQAKCKYNDLQVRFSEIAENLEYSQMLFHDNRDFEEIKLRNKKLENDLIHSNEKYLNELSKVRENFDNQMKSRTSMLQSEIDELRQRKDQIHLEHNKQINELQEVIETERSLQKLRFQDIITHFENILDRTVRFSSQLEIDFDTLKGKTSSLKSQTFDLECGLKREFSDNMDVLRRTLPFFTELNEKKFEELTEDVRVVRAEPDVAPKKSVFGGECKKYRNL